MSNYWLGPYRPVDSLSCQLVMPAPQYNTRFKYEIINKSLETLSNMYILYSSIEYYFLKVLFVLRILYLIRLPWAANGCIYSRKMVGLLSGKLLLKFVVRFRQIN